MGTFYMRKTGVVSANSHERPRCAQNRLSPPSVQRARLRGGKAIGVIAEEAHVEIGVLQWPPSYRAHVDTSRCACPSVRRREPHESRKRSSPERLGPCQALLGGSRAGR